LRWRLLPFWKHRAAVNMAIEEAVAEGVAFDGAPPTIRFYSWEPSAVSIGRYQKVWDEVDLEACARLGVDVVRRRTGGGAVFHDQAGEITYSVIAPEDLMGCDIKGSYRMVCGWVISALESLGISAEFAPINDVVVDGRKISGCAQTRHNGVFLQHGTVLYDLDARAMFSLLRVDPLKMADKNIASVEDRVTSVRELTGSSKADLLKSLHLAFCRGKEWTESPLTSFETSRAKELIRTRYDDRGWTYSR